MTFRKFYSSLCLLFLAGCATPGSAILDDLNVPLADLQKLCLANLPIGKRSESLNGRNYYSEYFITGDGKFLSAEGQLSRMSASISILGDRRPYKIEVRVPVERRDTSGNYSVVKYDEGIARVISRHILSSLHKRRDDRNIIDDFRVF